MKIKKRSFKRLDFTLLLTVLLICIYGIVMIHSATLTIPKSKHVKVQTVATIIGFIAILIVILLDYQFLGNMHIPIYIVSVGLLLATHFFGFGSAKWGSDSWLKIGPVVFQPAEFAKVGLIIFLSKYIDDNKHSINEPLTLIKILVLAMIPIGLIAIQPDFGTSVVFVFFLAVMLFAAGLDWKYIGAAFTVGIISLPLLWFSLKPYQRRRIFSFLDPESDPSGSAYQSIQAKIAIGSGKVFGRGIYSGPQTQYGYLPEKQTDFIFAVIGEELGFVGGAILIILYFIMLYRLIKIARDSKDTFGSLMVIGFTAMFLIHIWENIGMTIGLMPVTGIPLPFMSYGGTFQLINLVCIGIALSVGSKKEGLNFK